MISATCGPWTLIAPQKDLRLLGQSVHRQICIWEAAFVNQVAKQSWPASDPWFDVGDFLLLFLFNEPLDVLLGPLTCVLISTSIKLLAQCLSGKVSGRTAFQTLKHSALGSSQRRTQLGMYRTNFTVLFSWFSLRRSNENDTYQMIQGNSVKRGIHLIIECWRSYLFFSVRKQPSFNAFWAHHVGEKSSSSMSSAGLSTQTWPMTSPEKASIA